DAAHRAQRTISTAITTRGVARTRNLSSNLFRQSTFFSSRDLLVRLSDTRPAHDRDPQRSARTTWRVDRDAHWTSARASRRSRSAGRRLPTSLEQVAITDPHRRRNIDLFTRPTRPTARFYYFRIGIPAASALLARSAQPPPRHRSSSSDHRLRSE